jgi:hypothetical protein
MKKLVLLPLMTIMSVATAQAQIQLNHVDVSVTAGTDGIGFDVGMPVNDYIQVRAGASFMPHMKKHLSFDTAIGEADPTLSDEENKAQSTARLNELCDLLENVTGNPINQNVSTIREATFNNFKFLVDIFPFKNNKHWHVTAGFYLGGSRISKVYNTAADMTTLMGITIYNNMYRSALSENPILEYNGNAIYMPESFTERVLEYGEMGIIVGEYSHDIYADEDVLWDYTAYDPITGDVLHEEGDIRYAKGELMHHKGDEYRITPDENNMLKANAKTNSFRPYIGVGYSANITKDLRTSISVDAGMLMWGGTPTITMHDGTNVRNDLQNLRGKFADYVDSMSKLKVYPVINLRLTRRLF